MSKTTFKEKDLRAMAECHRCGRGFGRTALPLFARVRVQLCSVNLPAIQRQAGLSQFLGSPALAAVMGADEDMGKVYSETEITLCWDCVVQEIVPLDIAESGSAEHAKGDK